MPKFILADTTEERHLHQSIRDVSTFVSGLEELTGADFILTPLSIPVTNEALIKRHAKAGLCVQRKEVLDLAASITDSRLWGQLDRMLQVTDIPMLLLIGSMFGNGTNKLVTEKRETEFNYFSVRRNVMRWQLCGGYYDEINRDTQMLDWCRLWLDDLKKRNDNDGKFWPKKYVRPVPQTLYEIPNVQRTLLTLPGIGSDKAEAIYSTVQDKYGRPPSLIECFILIDDEKVSGIGPKIRKQVLDFVGWQDNKEIREETK